MTFTSIIITVLLLGVVAAVHEIGHFLVARAFKIKVYELSIFVGPALFSWKKNGVDYSIRLIPFGAYVRFSEFEEDEGSDKNKVTEKKREENYDDNPHLLLNQPRWKRLIVSLAGPVMNIFLGIAILTILFSVTGFTTRNIETIYPDTQIAQTQAEESDTVVAINDRRVYSVYDLDAALSLIPYDESIRLDMISASDQSRYEIELVPEFFQSYMIGITRDARIPAEEGWLVISVDELQNDGAPVLAPDDLVLSINGVGVEEEQITDQITQSEGEPLEVAFLREGQEYTETIKPILVDGSNPRGLVFSYEYGFFDAFRESAVFPISILRLTSLTIQSALSGDIEPYNIVAGPVGITSMVSDVVDTPDVESGVKTQIIILLAGIISIAIAFTNLLPIPGLDGNDIVLLLVELIRGKKISKKTEMVINVIGFALVIALVLFALLSDIVRMTR